MGKSSVAPKNTRYQILALSGGGFRGLYTAAVLESCEDAFNTSCENKFDLIVGTSIGALLAAGLSLGVPAKNLKAGMLKHGPLIFKKKPFRNIKRLFYGAPYYTEPLRDAIKDILGEDNSTILLSELDSPLLISAVNYTTGSASILASRGIAGENSARISIIDAILSSSAAPTFFPPFFPQKKGSDQFVDGGLIANAPDMIALINGISYHRAAIEDTYMLSIGTAGRRNGAAIHSYALNPSVMSWFIYRGLVQTTMTAQEDLALKQVSEILGDRHLRVDREPAKNQVSSISSLDKADTEAGETLISLAEATFDEFKTKRQLRAFF